MVDLSTCRLADENQKWRCIPDTSKLPEYMLTCIKSLLGLLHLWTGSSFEKTKKLE
jgi:hypothetical protein